MPSDALAACLEFIYAGEATVGSEAQLMTVLEAAAYLQMPELLDAAAAALTTRRPVSRNRFLHALRQYGSLMAKSSAAVRACVRKRQR